MEGPPKEVFFQQGHLPGALCASDFTDLTRLGVTIGGERFDHILYEFVLTYSNWATGTICFSEAFESLSEELQNALCELGVVPQRHRTDRLSAAVRPVKSETEFPRQYEALLSHYGLEEIQRAAQSVDFGLSHGHLARRPSGRLASAITR